MIHTGIFIKEETDKNYVLQIDECIICGKQLKPNHSKFYLDGDTLEILNPNPEPDENREFYAIATRRWGIGSECMKKYPGIEKYVADSDWL